MQALYRSGWKPSFRCRTQPLLRHAASCEPGRNPAFKAAITTHMLIGSFFIATPPRVKRA
jgi:hypothetical protein